MHPKMCNSGRTAPVGAAVDGVGRYFNRPR